MAHNLSTTKEGTTAFAAVVRNIQERPWHGLGQYVDKAMTTSEAIKLGGLDWEVERKGLYIPDYLNEKGKAFQVPDRFAICRKDTQAYLGTVGSGYEMVQNKDAFDFFDAIMKQKDAPIFETCGALGQGEKIFITAKLPDYIKIQKRGEGGKFTKTDIIEKYLFLTSSHNGSGPIICAFTPIRIVCNNTLQLALKNMENVVRIKHTRNAKSNLAIAGQIMGMVDTVSDELNKVFNEMANKKISDQLLEEFIACVMSPQDKLISKQDFENFYSGKNLKLTNEILEYAKTNDSQLLETTKGTMFGAYNAITGYYQNLNEWDNQEEKFDSLIISSTSTAKTRINKAFNLAMKLMN